MLDFVRCAYAHSCVRDGNVCCVYCIAEESFLSALVSGRHAITKQSGDDSIFIDRDGPLFRHVLNYLRRGRLIVATDDAVLHEELFDEAKFYQVCTNVCVVCIVLTCVTDSIVADVASTWYA